MKAPNGAEFWRELWRTVRYAIDSTPRTVRLMALLVTAGFTWWLTRL